MDSFSEALFEEKLLNLKDTQDSIANLSSWCLSNKEYHKKIVTIWLNVLKKVRIEHRLVLFYLANDVIQYSKRKSLPFTESFAPVLQKATKMVREDHIRNKVMRLFKIWSERGIYDEEFLVDLSNVLNRIHKNANSSDDFQSATLFSKIRQCKELEEDTDHKLNTLNKNHLSLTDVDKFRKTLKDREHGDELLFEFDAGIGTIEAYIKALETEITERVSLIEILESGEDYYEKEFQEAKIVVNAYKCFATRVRGVKRKLEEQMETMPSPIPSPDINAPSPSPEPQEISGCADIFSSDPKPSNFFPPDTGRRENDDISPYSPDSDFGSESVNACLNGSEEPDGSELQSSITTNSVENDSVYYKSFSDCFSNGILDQSNSLLGKISTHNNSSSALLQGSNSDPITSDKQQLSLSALLQTLIPSSEQPTSTPIKDVLKVPPCSDKADDSFESPESPPLHEKANYPTIADEQMLNQDIDMRFADIDDRNIVDSNDPISPKWPNDDVDYRTSGKNKKNNSQNQDNVENIDMEMSDDEEKLIRTKESEVEYLTFVNSRTNEIQPTSHQNLKMNHKINNILGENSSIPTTLAKSVDSHPLSSYSTNQGSIGFGVNSSLNTNSFKNCYVDYPSSISGKNDSPFPKLEAPLPPLFPPPPPPPPPHLPQLWSPGFTTPPPPPPFPTSQNFVQQPLFYPRPPPSLPPPQIPVMNRPYRSNFRALHRAPTRFQRW